MRCARLSSIAYIHDKTSDLPGYIYIYILISRLHQMYEGRNREGRDPDTSVPVFTPDNPGHRPRENPKPAKTVENAITWSSVAAA